VLNLLLETNYKKRKEAKEILTHRWFNKTDSEVSLAGKSDCD